MQSESGGDPEDRPHVLEVGEALQDRHSCASGQDLLGVRSWWANRAGKDSSMHVEPGESGENLALGDEHRHLGRHRAQQGACEVAREGVTSTDRSCRGPDSAHLRAMWLSITTWSVRGLMALSGSLGRRSR